MKISICRQFIKKINKKKLLFGIIPAVFLSIFLLSGTTFADNVEIPSVGLPSGGDLRTVVENVLKWLLGIFGFLAMIAFIVSGIIYLTSAGEKERAETAKKAMNYSIIGVIVGLSGYVVINAINSWLGGSSTF